MNNENHNRTRSLMTIALGIVGTVMLAPGASRADGKHMAGAFCQPAFGNSNIQYGTEHGHVYNNSSSVSGTAICPLVHDEDRLDDESVEVRVEDGNSGAEVSCTLSAKTADGGFIYQDTVSTTDANVGTFVLNSFTQAGDPSSFTQVWVDCILPPRATSASRVYAITYIENP